MINGNCMPHHAMDGETEHAALLTLLPALEPWRSGLLRPFRQRPFVWLPAHDVDKPGEGGAPQSSRCKWLFPCLMSQAVSHACCCTACGVKGSDTAM